MNQDIKRRNSEASRFVRGAMTLIALVLPTLSLAVLGTVWLWQNNLLLIWSLVASAVAIVIYGVERWIVSRNQRTDRPASGAGQIGLETETSDGDQADHAYGFTERERAASHAIEELAQRIDAKELVSREALQQLAISAVETVASKMHPEEKNSIWKFTVPEALALVERVSVRMNRFVMNNIPLGDRLTVGQLLQIYRWRGAIGVAEKAYDLWRILRFANPVTAISGEVRERLSGQLIEGLRSEFTQRLAQAYVREIGRAAIDLYSGRLRPDLDLYTDDTGLHPALARQPLRYFVIGQTGAGRSSVINALLGDIAARVDVIPSADAERFTIHTLELEDGSEIELVDTPGLEAKDKEREVLLERLANADAILLVTSAIRPDRAAAEVMLRDILTRLRDDPARRPPPVLTAMTHIDQLRPIKEWEPPYDIDEPKSPKGQSIRDAVQSIAEDLGVEPADVIPIAAESPATTYNADVLRARLAAMQPEAIRTQLARLADKASESPVRWRKILSQAVNAGRVVGSSLWRSRKGKPKSAPNDGSSA